MKELIVSRRTLIWLVLVGTTILSWTMGHRARAAGLAYASTAVIVLAGFKIRYVMLDFMELRHAPLPMRIAAEVWVVGLCATLLVLYWAGAPS